MPKTLFDVGASLAVLLRKHAGQTEYDPAISAMRAEQKARLIRHMIAGTCEPGDVLAVMKTLEAGFAAGALRKFGQMPDLASQPSAFKPFETLDPTVGTVSLAGRSWSLRSLRETARKAVTAGKRVSLFCFSPTTRYHRVSFESEGYWLQTGGLFGRSERSDRLIGLIGFSQRLHREKKRLEDVRNAKSD